MPAREPDTVETGHHITQDEIHKAGDTDADTDTKIGVFKIEIFVIAI